MRSLASHRFLCQRVRRDPDSLQRMAARLDYWMELGNTPGAHGYFTAWKERIAQGVDAFVELATEDSDYGQVMRSCSPICEMWENERERQTFFTEFNAWYRAEPVGIEGKPPFQTSVEV